MKIRDYRSSLPLALAAALVLPACGGGGGGGGNDGADLKNAGDAARIAFTAKFFAEGLAATADGFGGGPQTSSRPAQKVEQTESCEQGGSVTFDDEIGRIDYMNCRVDENLLLDGVIIETCNDNDFVCADSFLQFGEGGGSFLVDGSFSSPETGTITFEQRLRGTVEAMESAGTTTVTLNLLQQFNSQGQSFSFDTDAFALSETSLGATSELTIDGAFEVDTGSSEATCIDGRAEFTTLQTLIVDNNSGDTVGGQLRIDAGSDSAIVTYNPNGSITASVNGGPSETIDPSSFAQSCTGAAG